jgi:hypothetical protein
MKDPRCLVGLHDFSPYIPDPPAQGELPGVHLRCPRCRKVKFVRVDPAYFGPGSIHPGSGYGPAPDMGGPLP